MTARFSRKNFGNSHAYYVDGQKIPGVTSVIGVLDKPALVNWASETTARHAVENWPRLTGMSMIDRFEELKKARYAVNREATVRGKRIHDANLVATMLAHGIRVLVTLNPADFAPFADKIEVRDISVDCDRHSTQPRR